MAKLDVARKAARAYYGFSEHPNQFPRGTDVEVYKKGDIPVKESMFLSALAGELDKHWNDFVGSQSRTARISNFDMAHFANKLLEKQGAKRRVKPEDREVISWMAFIAENDPRVALLRVVRETKDDGTVRALLVNTEVTL
ncbi:MAG TPA: hypothetical protein VJ547_07890 [Candidatus Thermoplasmatota archaeon]|nr:hypothetical protein [Candidatus Thermoplasmatota archaeon]